MALVLAEMSPQDTTPCQGWWRQGSAQWDLGSAGRTCCSVFRGYGQDLISVVETGGMSLGKSMGLDRRAAGAMGNVPTWPLLWGWLSLALSPCPHAGCQGLVTQDEVGMRNISTGLGCPRGHNPGVLQTPEVSSSAATDTGARRHTHGHFGWML